jgi:hypothetical protein
MKFLTRIFVLLCISLIFIGCVGAEKAISDMATVMKGADFLKNFYQESSRLPADNDELIKFCQSRNDSLDLSDFSKFEYYLNSDSTSITIDFELKSSPDNKGSFSIDI